MRHTGATPKQLAFLLYFASKLLLVLLSSTLTYLTQRVTNPTRNRNDLLGDIVANGLIRLGPVYIKMGQILSTHRDILPLEICRHFSRLCDDVPAMRRARVEAILVRAYGAPLSRIFTDIFTQFDFMPIASASIAQVHRARLANGDDVAVKIVKHGVRERLAVNLLLLQCIAWLVNLHPAARQQGLYSRFQVLKEMLRHQSDMRLERCNQKRMFETSNSVYCRIPRAHDSHSRGDVLVMEYIDEIPGNSPHLVEADPEVLMFRIQSGLYDGLFHHGFVHGDPHPGNIFYTRDGRFCLVDFGIVVELSESEKIGLASFMHACSRREWDLAVRRLTRYFLIDTRRVEENYEKFAAEVRPVLARHYGAARHSMVQLLRDLYPIFRRYRTQYRYTLSKIAFMMVSGEGLNQLIAPGFDWTEGARRYTEAFSPYPSEEMRRKFDRFYAERIPGSMALRKRAEQALVAPGHLDRYVLPSGYPLFVESARGSKLVDVDGNQYIDLCGGYGAHILGYNHRAVREAISRQLATGYINSLSHAEEIDLAEIIVDALPGGEKAVFSNSGTEAVIHAIRLCRGHTGKDTVAKFEGHYHGISDQALVSACFFPFDGTLQDPTPVALPGVPRAVRDDTLVLQYGLTRSLERIREARSRLACVLVEPMPSESMHYDVEFLKGLRAICTELDLPLVFDEVLSGFRVAYSGVQGLCGVQPDLTCLGKIIGGGLPCGAVVGKARYIDVGKTSSDPFTDLESKVYLAGTFSGNSFVCATGKAVLTHLRDNPHIYAALSRRTEFLKVELGRIAARHNVPVQIDANRSLLSVRFGHGKSQHVREMYAGTNTKAMFSFAYYMRKWGVYMPELTIMFLCAEHSDEDLRDVCQAFDRSLDEMTRDGVFRH